MSEWRTVRKWGVRARTPFRACRDAARDVPRQATCSTTCSARYETERSTSGGRAPCADARTRPPQSCGGACLCALGPPSTRCCEPHASCKTASEGRAEATRLPFFAASRTGAAVQSPAKCRSDAICNHRYPLRDERAVVSDAPAAGIMRAGVLEAARRLTARGAIGCVEDALEASILVFEAMQHFLTGCWLRQHWLVQDQLSCDCRVAPDHYWLPILRVHCSCMAAVLRLSRTGGSH